MLRRCDRPGCGFDASAAYVLDTAHATILVEMLDDRPVPDAVMICRRHADALRPPKGWRVDDRRGATPSLFDDPTGMGSPSGFADPDRSSAVVRSGDAGGSSELTRSSTMAGRSRGRPPRPVRTDGRPADELPFGDRPLPLATAIERADPDETRAIPWAPRFDQSDDLDGLLRAASPLLSRAFGRRPPRTRDTP